MSATLVEVDGLWNEISNFCNGGCSNPSMPHDKQLWSVKKLGFDPVDPPYKINNQGTNAALNTKTLDMMQLTMDNTLNTMYITCMVSDYIHVHAVAA